VYPRNSQSPYPLGEAERGYTYLAIQISYSASRVHSNVVGVGRMVLYTEPIRRPGPWKELVIASTTHCIGHGVSMGKNASVVSSIGNYRVYGPCGNHGQTTA
jgi:hypothetical protein